jgi:hypothetical protein
VVELAILPTRSVRLLELKDRDSALGRELLDLPAEAVPIGPNSAGEGISLPRWPHRNRTTCPPTCRFGTYAFKYSRSTHSISSAT